MTTKDYAPMTTEQQAPSFSFLGSFAGFAAIGGAVVAAVAFGGQPLADYLKTTVTDNSSEFWKSTAETAGKLASGASDKLLAAGEYLGFKDEMAKKTAAAVAGAIGLGLGGSLISGAAHSGNNSALPLATHLATDTLGHPTP